MRNSFILFITCILFSSFGHCQSIIKKIDEGEKIIMEITPNGDRFTDPAWFHTFQFSKSNLEYVIILSKFGKLYRKVVSKKDLKKFAKYISKWGERKENTSLTFDSVFLKIGETEKHFYAIKNSDTELLDIMFKDNNDVGLSR